MILAQRVHLFPFRTQKLSSAEPKILAWRRAGKIGHCRHTTRETWVRRLARRQCFPCILQSSYSSLAQSVEHLTVNQGVTGSSPVGGAKLKEPRLARGSFNLIPPSEPEPAILSRNSQQPAGRLTHTLTFPRSGMRSLRTQVKVMVQTRFASLNRLITGCSMSHQFSTKGSCNARSFCFAFSFRTRTGDTLAQQSAARRAADAHFGVSAKRNAVAPTARQSDISPVHGRLVV